MTVLLVQCRPEDIAADEEYAAILSRGGLPAEAVRRVRLEQTEVGPLDDVSAVIMGGGPACVSDTNPPPEEALINWRTRDLLATITQRDLPFLGLCYGIGALSSFLGARVDTSAGGEEIGPTRLSVTAHGRVDPLLAGVPQHHDALVGHKEAAQTVPAQTEVLVKGTSCPIQMIRYRKNVYATQFHPEANGDSFALRVQVYRDRGYFDAAAAKALRSRLAGLQTPHAARILHNFVLRYAG